MLSVIVDTSEQKPWLFPADRFTTERRSLDTGDYSLPGLEGRFCIERKSLGDFVGTVIHDWLRFRKELIRMSAMDLAVIVVEADAGDIRGKKYESEAQPASVFGKAMAIQLDHGVPVLFWGPRVTCEVLVWQFIEMTAKKLRTS